MNLETSLMGLFAIWAASRFGEGLITTVSSAIYDIKELPIAKSASKRFKKAPLVSVLIVTNNSGQTIEACLTSLIKSSYRTYEVIIIDNGSIDSTKALVKDFITKHPAKKIHLIKKHQTINSRQALMDGYRRKAQGSLVIEVKPNWLLDKRALSCLVKHFKTVKTLAVAGNVQVLPSPRVSSLWQQFDNSLSAKRQKLFSLTTRGTVNSPAIMYEAKAFAKFNNLAKKLKSEHRAQLLMSQAAKAAGRTTSYAHTAVVYSPANSFRQILGKEFQQLRTRRFSLIYSNLLILIEPIVLTYLIYLAINLHSVLGLTLSWLLISALWLVAIWSDNAYSLRTKLGLSFYVPTMFIILYVLSLIRLVLLLIAVILPARKLNLNPVSLSRQLKLTI